MKRWTVASGTDCLATGKALRAGGIAAGAQTEPQYDQVFAMAQREFQSNQGPRGYLPFFLANGQKR